MLRSIKDRTIAAEIGRMRQLNGQIAREATRRLKDKRGCLHQARVDDNHKLNADECGEFVDPTKAIGDRDCVGKALEHTKTTLLHKVPPTGC